MRAHYLAESVSWNSRRRSYASWMPGSSQSALMATTKRASSACTDSASTPFTIDEYSCTPEQTRTRSETETDTRTARVAHRTKPHRGHAARPSPPSPPPPHEHTESFQSLVLHQCVCACFKHCLQVACKTVSV